MMLRRALWAQGMRYRLHPNLTGKPDIVFRKTKVAVFCDGDFWHGRAWKDRKAKLSLGANADYWIAKIRTNRARDRRTNRQLKRSGWHVVRVWESEINKDPAKIALAIRRLVDLRVHAKSKAGDLKSTSPR
jgi:DNA mismatch endonuclease (patch repair protein)